MTTYDCPQCVQLHTALSSLLREIDQQGREGLKWPTPSPIEWRLSDARKALGLNPATTTELHDPHG